ncbi:MAG: hypothetical protein IKX51_06725 [Bacteroidales bacterium]|nr:hypothetical protein [Bacteroidales bacterium]
MKKTFKFDGETLPFEADLEMLKSKLAEIKQLINSYQEVECDLDSPEYVARGNGFCDAKYSEDFIEGRIADLSQKALQLEEWINGLSK